MLPFLSENTKALFKWFVGSFLASVTIIIIISIATPSDSVLRQNVPAFNALINSGYSIINSIFPNIPTLVALLVLIGISYQVGRYSLVREIKAARYNEREKARGSWWRNFWQGISTELVGAFTTAIIFTLIVNPYDSFMQEQKEIGAVIAQIGSLDNATALQGIKIARQRGWLVDGSLSDTDLSNADLTNANLTVIDLTDANLTGANLTNGNLTQANLTNTDLTGANLVNANLIAVDMTNAIISSVNLANAKLLTANLAGVELRGVNLMNADLTGANLADANLARTNMTNVTSRSKGRVANFALAISMIENNGYFLNLSGTNMREADLRNASLQSADLRNAILISANLAGVDFTGSNLGIVDFTDANLEGADFTGVNLNGAILPDGTRYDRNKGFEQLEPFTNPVANQ